LSNQDVLLGVTDGDHSSTTNLCLLRKVSAVSVASAVSTASAVSAVLVSAMAAAVSAVCASHLVRARFNSRHDQPSAAAPAAEKANAASGF
jgi:hypothetical protein